MTEVYENEQGVVILGATSPIARAAAMEFAVRGFALVVAARDLDEAERIAQDLRVRYSVTAQALQFDALDYERHDQFLSQCQEILQTDGIEGIVVGFAYMPEQDEAQTDFEKARRTVDTNLTGAISILEVAARYFEQRQRGFITIISSVAGDRGRKKNYIYGASKAGLNVYAQGLRNRLHSANVKVTTIEPGFVDTRMTYGREGLFLVASPERAGRDIVRATLAGRAIAYVPWFWRWIMGAVCAIPEWKFKRMNL